MITFNIPTGLKDHRWEPNYSKTVFLLNNIAVRKNPVEHILLYLNIISVFHLFTQKRSGHTKKTYKTTLKLIVKINSIIAH